MFHDGLFGVIVTDMDTVSWRINSKDSLNNDYFTSSTTVMTSTQQLSLMRIRLLELEGQSVERMYLRQRCFDGSLAQ